MTIGRERRAIVAAVVTPFDGFRLLVALRRDGGDHRDDRTQADRRAKLRTIHGKHLRDCGASALFTCV